MLQKRILLILAGLFLFLPCLLPEQGGASHQISTIEELGKQLFFDPILSGNNLISCASCHNPQKGWSDGLPLARGFNGATLSRRTPTLINVGLQQKYFCGTEGLILLRNRPGDLSPTIRK
ncbi:MAG: cytochrome-c peroxidase [Bdellovibrionaceae bacterium]|nr:cytochrome-c peroxidase [Pseudobdellovibrionaceae bacterium]MDW8190631.1 cytochrome-c peroxidase [Pseudobdellovibrionaceae bacterium]